jgi:hypothetical protein
MTLEQACADAEQLLKDRAQDILRLWLSAKHADERFKASINPIT